MSRQTHPPRENNGNSVCKNATISDQASSYPKDDYVAIKIATNMPVNVPISLLGV